MASQFLPNSEWEKQAIDNGSHASTNQLLPFPLVRPPFHAGGSELCIAWI
jgi:hypothetical protein